MTEFKNRYNQYKDLVEKRLADIFDKKIPAGIYEPAKYVLDGGGKRIRPLLLMLSCEAVGGRAPEALDAACAIEILHNFTLVHDDIMDNALTRRGRETVHVKWDNDTAILAGDGLIGFAYRSLLKTKTPKIQEITKSFTEAIIGVCEGQSFDKEFELRKNVIISEYIVMIGKKTSELLKCCAEIGGLIGGGTENEISALKNYALNIGLAFQIQDDLLDITADESSFGKKTGGDLYEGKKTYLLLKALETVTDKDDKLFLLSVVDNKGVRTENEVLRAKKIYIDYGIISEASSAVENYTLKAKAHLNALKQGEAAKMLLWFSDMLLKRST